MAPLRLRGTASFIEGLAEMQAGPPVSASRYHGDECKLDKWLAPYSCVTCSCSIAVCSGGSAGTAPGVKGSENTARGAK